MILDEDTLFPNAKRHYFCFENYQFGDDERDFDLEECGLNFDFADRLHKLFEELVVGEEYLNESFKNSPRLVNHFKNHCGGRSHNTNVEYDFNSIEQYQEYEEYIRNLRPDLTISWLSSEMLIKDAFSRLLTKDDYTVLFLSSCGLEDDKGNPVCYLFHSFADDVTTNFKGGHSIDFCVIDDETELTRTLYPLSARKFKSRFEDVVGRFELTNNTYSDGENVEVQ